MNEVLGFVTGFLIWVGIATVPCLTDHTAARISVVVSTVWNLVGFYMLMVLAGLSQINEEMNDAARIAGAKAWQRFWRITLPLLRPTLLLIVVLSTTHATHAFGTMLLLTDRRPANSTRLRV